MANAKCQKVNAKWLKRKRPMPSRQWSMANGQWPMPDGQWPTKMADGKIRALHMCYYQSGGWQRLRRPRSKGDFENCGFCKKWCSSIVIRSKYALSDTGHIEAAGRPTKCVSSENEDLHCELEKNRDFLKIRKNATKSHNCKVKSFQKWKKSIRHFLIYWHSAHTPTM